MTKMPERLGFLFKRALTWSAALILLTMLGTYLWTIYREAVLESVTIGMPREEVERILGRPTQDRHALGMRPDCNVCPHADAEVVYKGNQSFWLGRLEDSLWVCYAANRVCGKHHVGL